MKPKIIKLREAYAVSYPVGQNMTQVTHFCADMAARLKSIYMQGAKLKFYVRGSSGAIMGAIISTMMSEYEIIICHIKKELEDSHSGGHRFRCKETEAPSIIIDDFIITGETIKAIYEAMEVPVNVLCVSGQVIYSDLTFKPQYIICGEFKETHN